MQWEYTSREYLSRRCPLHRAAVSNQSEYLQVRYCARYTALLSQVSLSILKSHAFKSTSWECLTKRCPLHRAAVSNLSIFESDAPKSTSREYLTRRCPIPKVAVSN